MKEVKEETVAKIEVKEEVKKLWLQLHFITCRGFRWQEKIQQGNLHEVIVEVLD